MLPTQQFVILALASTILANPHRFHHKQAQNQNNQAPPPGCVRQGDLTICTVTVTASRPSPAPAAATNIVQPQPQPSKPVPSANPSPSPQPAQPSQPANNNNNNNNAAASSAPAAGAQSGGQGNYMATVSQMRTAGGLPPLKQDTQLEANAKKTVIDAGPGNLKHELNPGSFAQVLAGTLQDTDTTFRDTYIQSWLCEIPTLPGLNGQCDNKSNRDETGHAEILTDPKKTKIGCFFQAKVWGCDLA